MTCLDIIIVNYVRLVSETLAAIGNKREFDIIFGR